MKLNLGCGKVQKKDYINIDIIDYGQEIVRDIEKGLPFTDNTIDEIFASHFLEHPTDIDFVMNEIHRVLKKGGILYFIVPSINNMRGFNFTHNRYLSVEGIKSFFERKDYMNITDIVENDKHDIHCKAKKL